MLLLALTAIDAQMSFQFLNSSLVDGVGIGKMLHIVFHDSIERGRYVAQQGQQLESYAVAKIERLGIGDILHILQPATGNVSVDFVAAKGQQRPDNGPVAGRYAMQPCYARATQKIDKERLYGIVAMMSRGYQAVALPHSYLFEKTVSQSPGSLLDRETFSVGILNRVELSDKAGQRVIGSQMPDERLVAVAVAWTQMEIAMSHTDIKAGAAHEIEQRHRIASATDSKEHPLPIGNKVLPANVFYEIL